VQSLSPVKSRSLSRHLISILMAQLLSPTSSQLLALHHSMLLSPPTTISPSVVVSHSYRRRLPPIHSVFCHHIVVLLTPVHHRSPPRSLYICHHRHLSQPGNISILLIKPATYRLSHNLSSPSVSLSQSTVDQRYQSLHHIVTYD